MKIVLVGEGGHSKVIKDMIDIAEGNELIGYLDDKYDRTIVKEHLFFAPLSIVSDLLEQFKDIKFIVAIGNNHIRKKVVEELNIPDSYYVSVIHPSSIISPSIKIGVGTVVMPSTVINADAKIGRHSIINTASVIEHDSEIGDFVHISPHATLTGAVKVDEGTHVGAGSTLIPNVNIGEWSVIGAGATVINNIQSHSLAVGTPAKMKKIGIGGV
ncbi:MULTISPECIES: acetyltransferase [unclassified Bacillus (in: firmicutes)]|uniref:acetyltransferase n=1 Tax=unclassified Bacillus (in: firmicutes) TaxID=185979 RepID=UPI001BE5A4AC|nr:MULTISPECIES: acetyltransferase [unclassified Bacillus (in: firmicutes)]MBT2616205.1 acetyltransferase [Bacillus sp. ISL-78]MBT2628981.1 acetyltransferase [Bacillus sp. ISL-101]MBT2714928.1 acetyltransferase [Bacillus sp. ISL-57]